MSKLREDCEKFWQEYAFGGEEIPYAVWAAWQAAFEAGRVEGREEAAAVVEATPVDDKHGWNYSPDITIAKLREAAEAIRAAVRKEGAQ